MVPVFDRMSPERILLTPNKVTTAVAELEGWVVDDGHLKKTFVCRNFSEAIAFIVAFSYACERIDHHPRDPQHLPPGGDLDYLIRCRR